MVAIRDSSSTSYDVAIVGGGIMGCLTAYHLGMHGLTTLIVERDSVGSQASGGAAGILTHYWGTINPALKAFSEESQRLHKELAQILPTSTGINYHYGLVPFLRVAFTQEDEEELRQWHRLRADEGNVVAWLSGAEAVHISGGWLSPHARAAVLSELEPQVDPYPFVLAVAQAAEAVGARIRSGEVVDILGHNGRVTGVALADGTKVQGNTFLLAMGPWSKLASPWLGLLIPVEPLRGQILRLSVPGPMPRHALIHIKGDNYILPKPSGQLLSGTTWELAEFDKRTTPEGESFIIEGALRLSPRIAEASVMERRACLRPLSLDDHPIIGLVPGWANLYIATGHGPEGILLSAATGKYLAQLMATGKSDYDLSPFSPARLLARPVEAARGVSWARHGT